MAKDNQQLMEEALISTQAVPLSTWHKRLAHLNHQTILKMLSQGVVSGLNLTTKSTSTSTLCTGCALGKMHRLPFPTRSSKTKAICELIHSDLCGPMQEPTPGGSRFFVIFKDDLTRWRVVHFLKHKSEVAKFFVNFATQLERDSGKKIKTLRSDNGGEYCSKEFLNWLATQGIRHETSAPYTPQKTESRREPTEPSWKQHVVSYTTRKFL